MLTLITGGSKSGKSRLGESLAAGLPGEKYYIATMEPFGEGARDIILRHRRQRAGKGFITVERYTDIGSAPVSEGSRVLLEDVGNLLANEMFTAGARDPAGKIADGIAALGKKAAELIVVTNQVDCDGFDYPPETAEYIRIMGDLNRRLAEMAALVTETVYGIPLVLKGELPSWL